MNAAAGAPGAAAICLAVLALVGLLPRVYFRPGRMNAQWWLNTLPLACAAALMLAAELGLLSPLVPADSLAGVLAQWLAIPLALAGAMLLAMAIGSHARPVAMWHQQDDAPSGITTGGVYARIRHPFYTSFLLDLCACALAVPHPLTLVTLIAAFLRLNATAAREERRLLDSSFGAQYAAYMARTGRFAPALWRQEAVPKFGTPPAGGAA